MNSQFLVKAALILGLSNMVLSLNYFASIEPDFLREETSAFEGFIEFHQNHSSDPLAIIVHLRGLEPHSKHGWHIHEKPIVKQNCSSAGGHYNPFNTTHGGRSSPVRHVGDLGNLVAGPEGKSVFIIKDLVASLYGNNSITNRSIVVHALPDDLGTGKNETSLINGNSGARLGCGNIVFGERHGSSHHGHEESDNGASGIRAIGNSFFALFVVVLLSLII